MEFNGKILRKIANYLLIKESNTGGIFKNFLTINKEDGKLYITKVIPKNIFEKERKKVYREVKNLTELKNNENILCFKEAPHSEHNFYIITEYCNGGNLKEFQYYYNKEKNASFNEKFIQKVINQILSGMEFMQKNNIVHRHINLENIYINFNKYKNEIINGDIPPEINYSNIDLDESFTIKIGNFYDSKNIKNSNEPSTILGEQSYISPEMAEKSMGKENSSPLVDDKIDIWSLGIVTYELLTGKTPFEGKNSEEIYNRIINGKYSFPNEMKISKEIISFIASLLQYYSDKRLSLEKIKEHPFLKKNFDEFQYIEFAQINNIEIDSKAPENSLKEFLNNLKIKGEINELKRQILNLNEENKNKIKEFEKELNQVESQIKNI